MQDFTGRALVRLEDLSDPRVGENLAAGAMDEDKTVGPSEGASSLQLSYPGSLDGGNRAPYRQGDDHLMAVVLESRRVEHLLEHGVFHDVDPTPRVLGETVSAQGAYDSDVSRSGGFADVLHGHRLREPSRRENRDRRGADVDANRGAIQLVRPMGQRVCHRLAHYDRRNLREVVSPHAEDDKLRPQLIENPLHRLLELVRERAFDA